MTQAITPVPVDAKTVDWPRKVATVLNRLQNTTAAAALSATWGDITGTLSAQTDLQAALDLKLDITSYTAADVLTKIKTVDGSGSGLDADLLDGLNSTAFQTADATLTALAAYNTNGLLTQTAADTFTGRTLTAGSAKISITNGNGVSGNPTVDLGSVASTDLSNSANIALLNGGQTFTADISVPDEAYGAGWDNSLEVPTKNAVYDKIEALVLGGGSYTDEQAQDAIGAMVDASLVYVDATPLLTRAALTGDVTASQGSNATTIANDAVTYAKLQNISATSRLLGRYSASSGDAEEITVGPFFSVSGGTLARTFRGALVKKSGNHTGQNFTSATVITWDAETYDTDSIHDTVTNNSRLTVPSGVTYVRLGGQIGLTNVTTSATVHIMEFIKNGSTAYDGYSQFRNEIGNSAPVDQLWSPVLAVTAGDYFELRFLCTVDTSVDVVAANSWFAMEIIA